MPIVSRCSEEGQGSRSCKAIPHDARDQDADNRWSGAAPVWGGSPHPHTARLLARTRLAIGIAGMTITPTRHPHTKTGRRGFRTLEWSPALLRVRVSLTALTPSPARRKPAWLDRSRDPAHPQQPTPSPGNPSEPKKRKQRRVCRAGSNAARGGASRRRPRLRRRSRCASALTSVL